LEVSKEGIPMIRGGPVQSTSDLKKLKLPDPHKDGRLPVFLEATTIMADQVGSELSVGAFITGPFTLASHIMNPDRLLSEIVLDPFLVHKVVEFATEVTVTYAKALKESGAHMLAILEPMATQQILSTEMFREFASPYIQKIVRGLKHPLILHICGNTISLIEQMMQTGVNALSVDSKVDLLHIKKIVGDQVCILGNIDPVNVLLLGKPTDVEEEVKKCIQKMGRKAYILSSGCEVPLGTPTENIEAMIKSGHSYGKCIKTCYRNTTSHLQAS
jgi:uroporphyrinogen decarboxylase